MGAGRNPILIGWAALTGFTAIAGGVVLAAPASESAPVLGVAGAITLVFSLLILPFAGRVERFIAAWHVYADSVTRGSPAGPPPALRGLNAIVDPVSRAIDRLRRREHDGHAALARAETCLGIEREDAGLIAAALDRVTEAVVVSGVDGDVRFMNRAAAHLLGADPVRALHRPLAEVSGPQLAELVGRVTSDESIEPGVKVSDGDTERTCCVAVTAVRDDHDEVIARVAVLREGSGGTGGSDLSADLVAHVSHELRTPLTSIRAYVELLLDGDVADQTRRVECYGIILEETDRLARLIENMLDLSRFEDGRPEVDRRAVDVGTLITRAAHLISLQAADKGITLDTSLPGHALVAHGNADMLHQVVLNLASNAVKYTRPGGRVVLMARADPLARNVVVSVRDSGLGIPAADLPHLFDKFYRIKSHRRAAEGTGLGLCLCKHIVETVHGGRIDVRSTPGVGSEFSFTIPAWVARLKLAA